MPVAKRQLRRLVEDRSASSIFALSMVVTLCWCVYLGIDTQRYPGGRSIYRNDATSIALELSFSGFFLVELVMRIGACRSTWHFVRNAWNLIDTVCVLGSLIDVLFVPAANALVPGTVPQNTETELNVFRSCRLFKLFRILRFSRASLDVNIFIKGLLSGLKESSIVWGMITGLVFVFSILLRTYATDEVRMKAFPSLGLTMHRLIVTGILLDDVADILNNMLKSSDWGGYVLFLTFVIISQYVLLNMLIGIIASVAGDVRGEEKARAKTVYLRNNLENVVECFIQDDGMISRTEFNLIIRNADVHRVLQRFGAEIEHLASIEESLYADTDEISFDTLLEAIGQMNAGKIATVRDIFHSQDVLKRALHSVELQLEPNQARNRRRSITT
jgi:voltage-gated sodium channel